MKSSPNTTASVDNWLLLIFQLPARPAYLRVKIWRRLKDLGAITVKNSVYILPATSESLEDFQWLLREIEAGGGEGVVCESRMVQGLTDSQLKELFDNNRDADYEAITAELQLLAQGNNHDDDNRLQKRSHVTRLRKRFEEIKAIDFFGANARDAAEGLLAQLEKQLAAGQGLVATKAAAGFSSEKIGHGHTWVTRKGVKVDRIASAWLIQRFIDPELKLKLVTAKNYAPQKGELRFDMFEAEYTHEGDKCTFEVLMQRAALDDAALIPIAEIVHDIDIKDAKYGRDETGGIRTLIAGICMSTDSDEERIKRGSSIFDDLHAYFKDKK